jgi:environmental stress-induced protein Ves
MSELPSQIQHLTLQDYQTKPWKNGKGKTQDILLLPKGSGHFDFDLRFALTPIVEKGIFSSFPEADRVITLIEGEGLSLEFDDKIENLRLFDSLYFDTSLAPVGEPIGGSVRVINVMVRRAVWEINCCKVVAELQASCGQGEMILLCALSDDCSVLIDGVEKILLRYDSLIVTDKCTVKASSQSPILYAHIKPCKI